MRPNHKERDKDQALLLEAAAKLVATRGWQGLSMRILAEEMGCAASTLYEVGGFKDHGLRCRLVERAFAVILDALSPSLASPQLTGPEQFWMLVERIKADPISAGLMAQVVAQASLTSSAKAEAFAAHYHKVRVTAIEAVAPLTAGVGERPLDLCLAQARRVVNWYIAACAVLASDPDIDHDELMAVALI